MGKTMNSKDIQNMLEAWKKATAKESKSPCPKCDGKGCDHCDDTGYHEMDEGALKKAMTKISDKDFGYMDLSTANKKQIDQYVDKTVQQTKKHADKMADYAANGDYKDAERHKSALDKLKDRLLTLKKHRRSMKEDNDMNLKESRAKHYKDAGKGETWDDMYKGGGAKQMKMDNAIDDKTYTDNEAKGHMDALRAGRAGPTAKPRTGDNTKNKMTLQKLRDGATKMAVAEEVELDENIAADYPDHHNIEVRSRKKESDLWRMHKKELPNHEVLKKKKWGDGSHTYTFGQRKPKTNEEVENVQEISSDLAQRYIDKASKDKPKDVKKQMKRSSGQMTAWMKLRKAPGVGSDAKVATTGPNKERGDLK